MIFKATLDKTSKFLSIGTFLLLIGIIITSFFFEKEVKFEYKLFLMIFFILILVITYILSVNSYEINKSNITIKRLSYNITIEFNQIKNIEKLEDGKLTWSLRTFGSGGLFGYFGKFWNKEFGNMTWYATRRDKAIMIITNEDAKIVITPDDPDEFMNEFNKVNLKMKFN